MPRRRRVLSIALLLALLGAGAGYRLAHHDGPSPVLRTVTVGTVPGRVDIDAAIDRAFVVNYQDESVSVLDARSGAVLGAITIGAVPGGVVPDVPTGRLFVLSGDDPTAPSVVLDAASEARVGTFSDLGLNQAVVDPRTGHFFLTNATVFGAATNAIAMYDGRTGALLHSTALAGSLPVGVALDARTDRVFAVDAKANTASMVQASSGRLLRTVKVGAVPVRVAVDAQTGRAFIPNTGANTVSVLDARSGAVLRTVAVAPHPAAAVVEERTGRVFLVHGRSFSQSGIWSGRIPAGVLDPPAGPVGVSVLDARTGAVLRTLPVGGDFGDGIPSHPIDFGNGIPPHPIDHDLAVDVRRDRVYVVDRYDPGSDGDGSVSALDARSGGLLHTIGVGRYPISLAVDEATARLFVVNSNPACVRAPGLWQYVPSFARWLLPFLPGPPKPDCNLPGSVSVIDTSSL